MRAFRSLVWAALCAGLIGGLFATAAHQLGTVPIILQAEIYEKAAEKTAAEKPAAAAAHEHGAAAHEHAAASEWEPADGIERTAYTLLADVLTGVGFALLLAAGLALRGGEVTWRDGLFWGLAGFATFTVAPGLGLPPELPGTEAAPLLQRQLWWLATAAATGGALALLAFSNRALAAILAAVLLVAPHLYGAPRLDQHAAAAPEALAHQFVVAVTVNSLLFWGVLGAATGYFCGRFQIGRPDPIAR